MSVVDWWPQLEKVWMAQLADYHDGKILELYKINRNKHMLQQIPVRLVSCSQLPFLENSPNHRGGPEVMMCKVLAT